jgi:hypothetical protein
MPLSPLSPMILPSEWSFGKRYAPPIRPTRQASTGTNGPALLSQHHVPVFFPECDRMTNGQQQPQQPQQPQQQHKRRVMDTTSAPSRPTRRASIFTGMTNSVSLPVNTFSKRVRFNVEPNECAMDAHSCTSCSHNILVMTEDECAAYWWNSDEIQYFKERAYQSVRLLSNMDRNMSLQIPCSAPVATSDVDSQSLKNESFLLCKRNSARTSSSPSSCEGSETLFRNRTIVLCNAYDWSCNSANVRATCSCNDHQYIQNEQQSLIQQKVVVDAIATHWVGRESSDVNHAGIHIHQPEEDFDVCGSKCTPRGLERHYLNCTNVHRAAQYRGKIIAYDRTRTYSDVLLAELSQRDTRCASIFAQLMGQADEVAISSSMIDPQ